MFFLPFHGTDGEMESGEKHRLQQQHSQAERPRDVGMERFVPRCCKPGGWAGLTNDHQESLRGGQEGTRIK